MRSSTKRLAGVAAALVLVAGAGVAYGALRDDGTTIRACTLNANGSVRIMSLGADSIRGHCTAGETEVTWNQQSPTGQQGERGLQGEQGLPGNTDSTVRRINMWLSEGQTVSAPVISAKGQLGTLSLTCEAVTYTTNTADLAEQPDVVTSYLPNVADSPAVANLHDGGPDHVTIPWDGSASSDWIEIMLEGKAGGAMSLTTIHGSMPQYPPAGCAYFFQMETADVLAPMTYSTTG